MDEEDKSVPSDVWGNIPIKPDCEAKNDSSNDFHWRFVDSFKPIQILQPMV